MFDLQGRNVVLESKYGSPRIVNDGVTVAKEVELDDPVENIGSRLVRQVRQDCHLQPVTCDPDAPQAALPRCLFWGPTHHLAPEVRGLSYVIFLFAPRSLTKLVVRYAAGP